MFFLAIVNMIKMGSFFLEYPWMLYHIKTAKTTNNQGKQATGTSFGLPGACQNLETLSKRRRKEPNHFADSYFCLVNILDTHMHAAKQRTEESNTTTGETHTRLKVNTDNTSSKDSYVV